MKKHYKKDFTGTYHDKKDFTAPGSGDYTQDVFGNMHKVKSTSGGGGGGEALGYLFIGAIVLILVLAFFIYNAVKDFFCNLYLMGCSFYPELISGLFILIGVILFFRALARPQKRLMRMLLALILIAAAVIAMQFMALTPLEDRMYTYAEEAVMYYPDLSLYLYRLLDKAPSSKAEGRLVAYQSNLLKRQYDTNAWFFTNANKYRSGVRDKVRSFYNRTLPQYEVFLGSDVVESCLYSFERWIERLSRYHEDIASHYTPLINNAQS